MKSFQEFAKTLPKHHRLNQFSASGEVNQIVICESEYNSIVESVRSELKGLIMHHCYIAEDSTTPAEIQQEIESELNKLKG